MADFSVEIAKFAEKAGKNIGLFLINFNQDLAEKVQENTPYKTGHLRASWTASIGFPDTSYKGGTIPDVGRIAAVLSGVKAGDIVYHVNNAPYAGFVEFGTSKMEPRAFVRKTIAQAEQIAENALRKIRK